MYHEVVSTVISVNIRKVSGLSFLLGCEGHNGEAAAITRDQDIYLCDLLHLQCNFKRIFLYISDFHFLFKNIKRQYDEGASFCTILSNNKDVFHWIASLKSWTFHQFHCSLKRKISSVDLPNSRAKWKIVNQLDTYSIPFSFQKTYHVAK